MPGGRILLSESNLYKDPEEDNTLWEMASRLAWLKQREAKWKVAGYEIRDVMCHFV